MLRCRPPVVIVEGVASSGCPPLSQRFIFSSPKSVFLLPRPLQLSSCQIYNVEKRIQEDNLQQLALFAEYGRMALNKEQEMADAASSGIIEDVDDMTAGTSAKKPGKQGSGMGVEKLGSPALKGTTPVGASAVGFAAKARTGIEARARNIASGGDASGGGSSLKEGNGVMTHGAAEGASGKADVSKDRVERPFQRLEFLVRDWQVCTRVWSCVVVCVISHV